MTNDDRMLYLKSVQYYEHIDQNAFRDFFNRHFDLDRDVYDDLIYMLDCMDASFSEEFDSGTDEFRIEAQRLEDDLNDSEIENGGLEEDLGSAQSENEDLRALLDQNNIEY